MHLLGSLPESSIARFPILTSSAMLGVWRLIGQATASTVPVFITGEPGCGHGLVARTIHACSPRSTGPFLEVNLATLPPVLVEAELFGESATDLIGATIRGGGCFEDAGDGTLFLDEIGDLDPASQTRLMRAVRAPAIDTLRDGAAAQSRARLISATSRPIRPGITGTTLREDLYDGLAVIEIELPPLRSHRSDIPLLVAHALRGTHARAVSEEAMHLLLAYRWPGNIRELCNVVAAAAMSCGGEIIEVASLPEIVRRDHAAAFVSEPDVPRSAPSDEEHLSMHVAIARLERQMILRALDRAQGNRSAAARILGVNRPLLYAKMLEHGINGHLREPVDTKDRADKEFSDVPRKAIPETV
jgi:DNA-binding NtrC family response regulator